MRDKLNENPIAQAVLVGVLLLLAAVFLLGKMGGGSEEEGGEESAAGTAAVAAAAAELEAGGQPAALPLPGSGPGSLPPPPRPVLAAFESGQTVALLFVRKGGIDDRIAAGAVRQLESEPEVATFVVTPPELIRYVTIAQGVDLSQLPALIVIRPKDLDQGIPSASIQYGFQDPSSIVQAVVDANYRGRYLPYHP